MKADLPSSAARVQESLKAFGLSVDVVHMPGTTRTAKEAAETIGCTVAQIAKSLIFRGTKTGKAVLVVASGTNRVNEKQIQELSGEVLERATPDFVRSVTGYVIGGVPPLGFPAPIETWIDEDLLKHSEVWAAAGTPFSVFRLPPELLPKVTAGRVVQIT